MLNSTQNLKKCKEEKIQIKKDVPEKDVELTLELEMDEEVKEIISCPEKYADTMLDVTVIKPKIDKLYSTQKKIMSCDEVKKFIEAMNSAKPDHQAQASNNISTEPSKSPMSKFAPNVNKEVEKENVKQVYATPKTFTDINSLFECTNKHLRDEHGKPESPCICKNCSIVGVVGESQKKPFVTEKLFDPRDRHSHRSSKKDSKEDYNRKKLINSKEEDHTHCQYYYKQLSDKIRSLEARIIAQEERSVAKDYFKKIITKVLNHISKVTAYASQPRMETTTKTPKSPNPLSQKLIVNPVSIEKEKENGESAASHGSFWKWGEDLLKPSIDLKNKLIILIEDTLNSLKKSKNNTKEEDIKHFVEEFSAHLHKTVQEDFNKECKNKKYDVKEKYDKLKTTDKSIRKPLDEPISVTYVNSKILKWKETETTFKFESDRESVKNMYDQKKIQEIYKLEFMKTLRNTKQEDKVKLWCSIWSQATKNRQDKNDKVTIQIPDRRDPKRKPVEIIYTLGELEYLLVGSKT